MLRTAVTLDAGMPVGAALARLARNGYWLTPDETEAGRWIDQSLAALRKTFTTGKASFGLQRPKMDLAAMTRVEMAKILANPVDECRVVIRRQDGTTIFWYHRVMREVLQRLSQASPTAMLVADALGLHEDTSNQPEQINALDGPGLAFFQGVVLNGTEVYGVGDSSTSEPFVFDPGTMRSWRTIEPVREPFVPPVSDSGAGHREIRAYPLVDAPTEVVVNEPFTVKVGLSKGAVAGVLVTSPVVVAVNDGAKMIDIDVQVIADNFDSSQGWSQTLRIDAAAPHEARVLFTLTAKPQNGSVRLTSLIVNFSVSGAACGSGTRHLIVSQLRDDVPPVDDRGQDWLDLVPASAGMVFGGETDKADVELDIFKPDANAASGKYRCVFRNSKGLTASTESFAIDLGDDSETFAKNLIDDMRRWGDADPVVHRLLEGIGSAIADKLPHEFWKMLAEVSAQITKRPVTLQISSAEPFVPWELALVDPPLDPAMPPFLGTQVAVGRWILGDQHVPRPPRNTLSVSGMAVMAGLYSITSNLRSLPMAIEEAAELARTYAQLPVVSLDATPADLDKLLAGNLSVNSQRNIGPQIVHFAGHGEVDPMRPGDAALFLKNGRPVSPLFLRHSELGAQHSPFLFLNACMVGTGGKLLGDYGGFPGNSLAGGFSGLVAPLWAVNDEIAKRFALDFYEQVLSKKRPVAEVVRQLRCGYTKDAPIPSLLAYVYYGNPNLKFS